MALFRIFLLFLLFYLIFKLIFRVISGYNRRRNFFAGADNQQSEQKRDGQVTVNNKSSSRGKKIQKGEGEYVKFEEIKKKD